MSQGFLQTKTPRRPKTSHRILVAAVLFAGLSSTAAAAASSSCDADARAQDPSPSPFLSAPDDGSAYGTARARALCHLRADAPRKAAQFAARAYRLARTPQEQLDAARISSAARFGAGHHVRAEWWLRRAANHAETDAEIAQIRQDFQTVRQQNPLDIRFDVSIAPSDNINGGARDQLFFLDDFAFLLAPSSLALSGIEYAAAADLSYRLSQGPTHRTSAGLYLFGRTFSLSAPARAAAPDVSGSDYALALAEASLTHERILAPNLGPTYGSLALGQVWYGGDRLWQHARVSLGQTVFLGQNASASLEGSVEFQKSQDPIQPDATLHELRAGYARRLANQDTVRIGLGYRWTDADLETYTHTNPYATLDYSLARPVLGSRLAFSLLYGTREYDVFSLSLDGRRDTYVRASASALFEQISYFGFSPSVTISAGRQDSNVSRFSTKDLQMSLGFQSTF